MIEKTNFVLHRCNTISSLDSVKPEWGVEIDLRSDLSQKNYLHLSHEPWERGESFKNWLEAFKQKKISGPIILNTKEDGLEKSILDQLANHGIKNYFFLDTALPTMVKWTKQNKNFSVRLSSYEPTDFVEKFKGLCDWVWVDCFDKKYLDLSVIQKIKKDFKICLVSPELQGGDEKDIARFRALLSLQPDLICTKKPSSWIE